jgi:hypothetical protein
MTVYHDAVIAAVDFTTLLKLSGLVISGEGWLRMRNRIYD